jgi:hypothetical protein
MIVCNLRARWMAVLESGTGTLGKRVEDFDSQTLRDGGGLGRVWSEKPEKGSKLGSSEAWNSLEVRQELGGSRICSCGVASTRSKTESK